MEIKKLYSFKISSQNITNRDKRMKDTIEYIREKLVELETEINGFMNCRVHITEEL